MKKPQRLRRRVGAQQLDQADARDPEPERAQQHARAARAGRPERGQREDQGVQRRAVRALPGEALLVGPEDREVAPGGEGRPAVRAPRPAPAPSRRGGRSATSATAEQREREQRGGVPGGRVVAGLGGAERDQRGDEHAAPPAGPGTRVRGRPAALPCQPVPSPLRRLLLKLLYWLAVLAISLALVIGLILFFESRDQSSVESGALGPALTSA